MIDEPKADRNDEGQEGAKPQDDGAQTGVSGAKEEHPCQKKHPPYPPIEIDFSTFVLSLSQSAFVHLGAMADPDGNRRENYMLARQTIDILSMIKEKTKGNLEPDEEKLLCSILCDVKLRFVEITGWGK